MPPWRKDVRRDDRRRSANDAAERSLSTRPPNASTSPAFARSHGAGLRLRRRRGPSKTHRHRPTARGRTTATTRIPARKRRGGVRARRRARRRAAARAALQAAASYATRRDRRRRATDRRALVDKASFPRRPTTSSRTTSIGTGDGVTRRGWRGWSRQRRQPLMEKKRVDSLRCLKGVDRGRHPIEAGEFSRSLSMVNPPSEGRARGKAASPRPQQAPRRVLVEAMRE